MADNFCKSLTNSVSFKIQGNSKDITFNPCCVYKEHIPFNKVNFYKEKVNFSKINKFTYACSGCQNDELSGKPSLRKLSNRTIPDNLRVFDTHKLEIVLDTTCNAACIQCGPLQSSLWRKELNIKSHIQSSADINDAIDKISEVVKIDNVKEFFFWGGEPLLTDTHLKILRQVKNFENIKLMYTTNGSVLPDDETIAIWKKCKSIRLNFSIDGVEDRFHYMRWPLAWDKITQNLKILNEINFTNLSCGINFCLTPINTFYLNELINWKNNNEYSKNLFNDDNFINLIKVNAQLDLGYTPASLRRVIIQKYGEDHTISKYFLQCPELNYTPMLKYLNEWDNKRNLNWRKIFNEVEQYFT